jgi:arylsulfatase A-like enzyme
MRHLPLLLLALCSPLIAAPRPNILWLTVEDMSPNLGCYGDDYATTPNLDNFARDSVRYTRAFATAPCCSPSRSTLITGCYATSLGTQRLRSEFAIPDHIRGYARYLRDAGWFTSNNVKTDYNFAGLKEFCAVNWDQNSAKAHWRQREDGQPFFSIFNITTTHQSRTSVWSFEQFEKQIASKLPAELRHDPAKAPIWPYYPDTSLVRRTVARYYDCITRMDQEVGDLLRQLEDDGLADNTIVFFYSDHGMGMPRGKRLLHDSGMHVPMMIRFPEKWQHLAPSGPGTTTDRLVSFIDFAPTVLSIAGLDIPGYMQGSAFLGPKQGPPRSYVYGARDRVDEVFELSRSIRDKRYLLIRNYMPHLSWMPPEFYSDQSDMRRELKQLAADGRLNAAQTTYAAPRKPTIEFFDTQKDPHQIHNLADDPAQQDRIKEMLAALQKWQEETNDLGFFTEPNLRRRLDGLTPLVFGRKNKPLCTRVRAAADGASSPNPSAHPDLEHPDPAIRYWAVIHREIEKSSIPETKKFLLKALSDDSGVVRVEAAAALAKLGEASAALPILEKALTSPCIELRVHAIRHLELLGRLAAPAKPSIQKARDEAARRRKEGPNFLYIQFSADAALAKLASSG